jgi:hypothetical protein
MSAKTQTYNLHHIRAHIVYHYLYVHRRRRITRMQGGLPAELEAGSPMQSHSDLFFDILRLISSLTSSNLCARALFSDGHLILEVLVVEGEIRLDALAPACQMQVEINKKRKEKINPS